jgi:hypothetical protein
MKAIVRSAIAGSPDISLDEIDISADRDLTERYGLEIPVLTVDGKKVAKYRVSPADVRKMIERRQL